MILLTTAATFYVLGLLMATRRDDPPVERLTYAAVAGAALWLSSSWILALTHNFTRVALGIRLILAVAVAAGLIAKHAAALRNLKDARVSTALAALFTPVALWIAYVLWRGTITPALSHDALAYHLPKATLIAHSRGYEHFSFLIPAIRTLPANYELLLADVIVWTGSDRSTEWISTIFYVFFVISAGALAERWWGRSALGTAAVMLSTASIPVVLLQSGAHKNDLMVAAFMVSGLVAAGRWIDEGDHRALLLMMIAFACGVGTKPQAAILALALTPFVAARLIREVRTRQALIRLSAIAAAGIIMFLLLGGAVYVINYAHEGALLNAKDYDRTSFEIVPYGDWANLYQGPFVLLSAPLSRNPYLLTIPWQVQPWFWRRYEIYFSSLGVQFTIAVLTLPFAIGLGSRLKRKRSAIAISIAAFTTFIAMLPVGFRPHGMYVISLPRYALFIVPVVFGWTIAPWMVVLERRSWSAAIVATTLAATLFSYYAIDYGLHDRFAPFDYVLWARSHPEERIIPFDPDRAASVADRVAGRHDVIAIDAGFGTWIQPAFGADLNRPVEFIPEGNGPPAISPETRFVVIDRAFSVVWGHPDFRDLGDAGRYMLRGNPSAHDLRVLNYLRADRRFELVFEKPAMVQAVFRRVRH